MIVPIIFSNLLWAFRQFKSERRGNVAVTFAIATLPIISAVGAAVDYSRANSVKAALQSALDSTALMLSRDAPTLSTNDLQSKAKGYFLSMFNRPDATNVTVTATYSNSGGSTIVVDATADVPTSLMAAVGYDYIALKGSATSKWGTERLRVALVLDNTGSMASNGKMTALKTATKNLLNQLKGAVTVSGDVYVSIIPFARVVNAGSVNSGASWLDWTDWDSSNGSCASYSGYSPPANKTSCLSAGGLWTASSHSNWNGCVADRGTSSAPATQNYDQNVTAPGTTASSKFPAWQDSPYCPIAMAGLSYEWTSMASIVDGMNPAGGTNQPIGLVWGWQSLVGGGPLSVPAKDSNYNYKEYIILLSDGLNTIDRWYGNGSSVSSSVDKRMYDSTNSGSGTCANIKAASITIYAIQVNTDGDPTSTIMKNCASGADKFFVLTSANDIVTTFQSIGTNLTKLRVAK